MGLIRDPSPWDKIFINQCRRFNRNQLTTMKTALEEQKRAVKTLEKCLERAKSEKFVALSEMIESYIKTINAVIEKYNAIVALGNECEEMFKSVDSEQVTIYFRAMHLLDVE